MTEIIPHLKRVESESIKITLERKKNELLKKGWNNLFSAIGELGFLKKETF